MYCGEICGVQCLYLLVELLLGVSEYITENMELLTLGAALGVKEHKIDSILHDHRGINEASYKVLVHWRQEGIENQREGSEMLRQLKDALCSKHVGKNQIVAELKDYFCPSRESNEDQHLPTQLLAPIPSTSTARQPHSKRHSRTTQTMSPSTPAPSTSTAQQPKRKNRHIRYKQLCITDPESCKISSSP